MIERERKNKEPKQHFAYKEKLGFNISILDMEHTP
jgi:hypothetical protein